VDTAAAIHPFTVSVSDVDLTELGNRIRASRWPEKETVNDQTQGVQLATIQAFARYWAATTTTCGGSRRDRTPSPSS
jgi:hypothetical protein